MYVYIMLIRKNSAEVISFLEKVYKITKVPLS